MKGIKIYTKTGDKGMTSLFNGDRKVKSDGRFWLLGGLDELNAAIGLAKEAALVACPAEIQSIEQVESIQHWLFQLGSFVATPRDSQRTQAAHVARTPLDATWVTQVENWIDIMEEGLPPLRNFILPGGGVPSCQYHWVRTVSRRVEREFVDFVNSQNLADDVEYTTLVLPLVNRLSDYFFVLARHYALKTNNPDKIYKNLPI